MDLLNAHTYLPIIFINRRFTTDFLSIGLFPLIPNLLHVGTINKWNNLLKFRLNKNTFRLHFGIQVITR